MCSPLREMCLASRSTPGHDGTKKSGAKNCDIPVPDGLFEHVVYIDIGRSMLRRFQMNGQTLEAEGVTDRLMLTY